jgi:hypothetical protein
MPAIFPEAEAGKKQSNSGRQQPAKFSGAGLRDYH